MRSFSAALRSARSFSMAFSRSLHYDHISRLSMKSAEATTCIQLKQQHVLMPHLSRKHNGHAAAAIDILGSDMFAVAD